VAVLQYTGGTTGVSKGAVLQHRNVVANLLQSEVWNGPVTKNAAGEQYHGGLCVAAVPYLRVHCEHDAVHAHGRQTILIPNPRDLPAVLAELSQTHSTAFRPSTRCSTAWSTTPTFGTVNWGNLKVSVGGGMAVQSAVAKLWLEKTGCPIVRRLRPVGNQPVGHLQSGDVTMSSAAPLACLCPAPG
jgi:long-chain acyl-CoA synthetase